MYALVAYLDEKLDENYGYGELSLNEQEQWSSDQSETDTL